ncbi:MAG: response regulator transcription factor [Gammaproteobacteria bacterium]
MNDAGRPPRVLIVEDDDGLRPLIRYALEQKGFRVACAENGAAALDVLGRESVDLLIVDLQMPVMDGLTLLRTLREQGRQYPVVVLSAAAEPSRELHLTALGAAAVLRKPVPLSAILAAVQGIVAWP